ncbi:MAG: NAD-dependent epimerase/dehydratase family protein [Planctomycetota bacterium]
MAVFLTGSTGFLGQRLVEALTIRRTKVKALVRPNRDTSVLDPDWVEPVGGDLTDASVVRATMSGCDTVIHTALPDGACRRNDHDRVNVEGFRHVMDAAWHHGVKHIVYVSSFLALGPSFGEVRNEEHLRGERQHPTGFERTRGVAEGLTRSYISGGLPLSVVYPTLMYGPGEIAGGNLLSQLLVDRADGRLTSPPFDHGHRLSLAYVGDVADGICRVLAYAGGGDRFILGGENISVADILRVFASVGGLRGTANIGAGSSALSRLAAWGTRLARMTSPATRRILDLMQEDWAFSSARAEEQIGYKIRPLKDGMRRTVDDLRERGLLRGVSTVNATRG